MRRHARDPVNDFVRQRIRSLRLSKKLSTRQLAALSGIPEGSYCGLESGSYRISIANLDKIMSALGTSIREVWPQPMEPLARSSTPAADLSAINYFRFCEICALTETRSAALLSFEGEGSAFIFENNLGGEGRIRLLGALEQGHPAGQDWLIYQKSTNGRSICLALKNAVVEGRLGVLVELYMDLWLATQVAGVGEALVRV